MARRIFSKDQVIFREGDTGTSMYDIHGGSVGIYANYQTENETLLTTLGAGTYFGEMAMLEAFPRSATAVALEDDTEADEVSADDFKTYFSENPDKVFEVMQHLSSRLRIMTGDYLEACRTIAEMSANGAQEKDSGDWLASRIKKFSDAFQEYYGSFGRTYEGYAIKSRHNK